MYQAKNVKKDVKISSSVVDTENLSNFKNEYSYKENVGNRKQHQETFRGRGTRGKKVR